ncbi:MAG: hypothetical protein HGB18_00850 [Candidatus Moranbacteria bacterium]|nr:hypothetical protein [Candidatus Moranbacteria bacterium]
MNLTFLLPYPIGPVEAAIRACFRDGAYTHVIDESHTLPSLSILPSGESDSGLDNPVDFLKYAILGTLSHLGRYALDMPESTHFFVVAAMTVRCAGVSEPTTCLTPDEFDGVFRGLRSGTYLGYRFAVQTVRSDVPGKADLSIAPLVVPGAVELNTGSLGPPMTDAISFDPIGTFFALFPDVRDVIVREVGAYLTGTCVAYCN